MARVENFVQASNGRYVLLALMTTSGHPKARKEENEALTCELLEHEERTRGAELAAGNAYKQHGELNK